jgi:hypothetical protein
VIQRFVGRTGPLVICGGTTARIASRQLGRAVEVQLDSVTAEVPALSKMEGIDLVTEGILTLTKVRDLLAAGAVIDEVWQGKDGASELIKLLLSTDHCHIMIGSGMNPAHQNPNLPSRPENRSAVVRQITKQLELRGKEVTLEVA